MISVALTAQSQNLQAMDNSHVALVSVALNRDGFTSYRCDHSMPLGVNLVSLTKVLKCAKDDDQVTLTAKNDADTLELRYEAKSTCLDASHHPPSSTSRVLMRCNLHRI